MDTFLVILIGWIFSLCLHEFSHSIVAYWGGDLSVKDKGYLSFNPLKYADPIYSLAMPVLFLLMGGFGLPGGAVYIDRSRLRSDAWRSAVSLAGPLSNGLLALIIAILLQSKAISLSSAGPALSFLGLLQVSALVLNLLPIPPLDGFNAIAPYLPDSITDAAYSYGSYGVFIIFACFWYIPAAGHAFWGSVNTISEVIGISPTLAYLGLHLFEFWKQ